MRLLGRYIDVSIAAADAKFQNKTKISKNPFQCKDKETKKFRCTCVYMEKLANIIRMH